ncbi:alkaline phosphatase [Virgibacillus dakarensis]|uniref:alkaline phosphatase n=1 Tax=Virgibacillus dakarensis TaxID=1917889 RepID=UPI0013562994|nr:alkaline phosphatase [Virgibacillus dakarensis]MBT2215598.1 alkaline phosphatase [Virgibacillus dakarensis]
MKKNAKKLVGVTLAGVLSTSVALGIVTTASGDAKSENLQPAHEDAAKNVILLVGDGMGQNQVSAAAYYKGSGYGAEDLIVDQFTNVGYARTFSHDNTVTDSAAAATAFSSTHKTDNGVLGKAPKNEEHHENEEHFNVDTVLESAEESGMSTGLVSTARITHATPAAFASHIGNRDEENNIAEQMLLNHDIEVLLGGGKRHFLPKDEGGKREDGKNLLNAAKEKGYKLIENKKELENADADKLLGLFNESHMSYELDRDLTGEPSLQSMTGKALNVLKDDKDGFFLMVEGGRIDHAGHANWPATNIQETLAFDKAVQEALEFAKKDKNTIVIVTADHETGGMSIGADGVYGFNKEVVQNVKRTPEYISSQFNKEQSNIAEIMAEYTGIKDLKKEEEQLIKTDEDAAGAIAKIISERALIGWTTTGHTGVNVPVYAYGPLSERLTGTIDNTKIAELISKTTSKSLTSLDLKEQVQQFEENGEITNHDAAQSLLIHLTTVGKFEQKGAAEKVIKHLTNFNLLLDQQKQKDLISTNAYDALTKGTESLLAKWQ